MSPKTFAEGANWPPLIDPDPVLKCKTQNKTKTESGYHVGLNLESVSALLQFCYSACLLSCWLKEQCQKKMKFLLVSSIKLW